jgi:hypothetical protein
MCSQPNKCANENSIYILRGKKGLFDTICTVNTRMICWSKERKKRNLHKNNKLIASLLRKLIVIKLA